MQARTLKPRKSYPKHAELRVAPPDPNTSIAWMLKMVGERKKVLDVGCASGYFANLLLERECDVVGVDINPTAAEEARRFCTSVIVADLDEAILPELLSDRTFDVVAFGDVLEHLHEPVRTLDESRDLLQDNGYVVASIPNITHGAIRLAMLSGRFDYQELGILDDSHLRFFTAKTIDELFLTAGFRIDAMERVTLPLFSPTDLVPPLDPRDFDEQVVADIRSDPDSETLQFVVKAFPLSNDQRFRAVSKRFLAANTELSAAKQQIGKREREVDELREALESHDAAQRELRERADRLTDDLGTSREEYRKLEHAHQLLEAQSLAKESAVEAASDLRAANGLLQNRLDAALERLFATQPEQSQKVEPFAEVSQRLTDALRRASDVEGQVASLEAERSQLAALAERLQTELATALQPGAEAQTLQEHFAAERERVVSLQSGLAAAIARADELQQSRDDVLQRTETLERELAAAAEQRGSDVQALQEHLAAERERAVSLQSELAAAIARADELQRSRDDALQRIETLERELAVAGEQRVAETQALQEQLAAESERVDELRRDLVAERGRAVDLEQMATEAEQRSLEFEKRAEAVASDLATSREATAKLKVDMGEQLSAARRRGADLERLLTAAEEQRLGFEKKANEAKDAAEAEARLRSALEQAESELQVLQTRLSDELQRVAWIEAARSHLAVQLETLQGVCRVEIERREELQYELDCNHLETAIYRRSLADTKRHLSEQLGAERNRGDELEQIADQLQMRVETLNADVEAISNELVESKRAFVEKEREFSATIAQTETACEELLAEAGDTVIAIQACLERERDLTDSHRREAAENVSAIQVEVEAIRKAALADRGVMRAYADDFRQRAEKAESEFVTAIRQRDELYLDKLELDRTLKEVSKNSARLEEELNAALHLKADLTSLTAQYEALQAQLAETDERLVAQTEELVANAAAESARLATLIDTVQSSHFWKAKHWLSRFRSRALGALR